jgi:hypothetical protein
MNTLVRKAAEKAAKEIGQGIYTEKGKNEINKTWKKGVNVYNENKENMQNAANFANKPLSIDTFERYNKSPLISPTTPPKLYLGGVRRKTKRRKTKKRRTMRRKKIYNK